MSFKKHYLSIVTLIISSLLLSSCSAAQEDSLSSSVQKEAVMVPVSRFMTLPFDFLNTNWVFASQDELYYTENQWDKEKEVVQTCLYRWEEGMDSSALLTEHAVAGDTIYCTFLDASENRYFFGQISKNGTPGYYLRKCDADGTEQWISALGNDIGSRDAEFIQHGAVDGEGNICLLDYYGNLYFFDDRGSFRKMLPTDTDSPNGLVRTSRGGICFYYFDRDEASLSNTLVCQMLDLGEGVLGEAVHIQQKNTSAVQKLWSGSDGSILYTDRNTLWELSPDRADVRELLSWNGEYVNIDGGQVQDIALLEDGSLLVYLYDEAEKVSEYAAISWQDKNMLPIKKTITIGITEDPFIDSLRYYAKRFNRNQSEWNVSFVEYFSHYKAYDNYLNEFTLDVVKGNAPDIIDTRAIPIDFLKDKKIFEDLTAYFEDSNVVTREDMLDSVWRAGSQEGEMQLIMPWFTVQSCAVLKEHLDGGPWTLDAFLGLSQSYPDAEMLDYMYSRKRLGLLQYVMGISCNVSEKPVKSMVSRQIKAFTTPPLHHFWKSLEMT